MYIKDITIQDGVLIDGCASVSFTVGTAVKEYYVVESLDKRYKINRRDRKSTLLRRDFFELRQYLSQVGITIDRLFNNIDQLIVASRNKRNRA